MRAFYIVVFALLVVALAVLEVASSRAASQLADYPDPPAVSASPALAGR